MIQGNAAVVLQSWLKVQVMNEPRGKKIATPSGISENGVLASDRDTQVRKQVMQYQVLNEVAIDRGSSSYLSKVDIYLDRHLITMVQRGTCPSGVIVSIPMGSTANAWCQGPP